MQILLTEEEYNNLVSKEKYEKIYKGRDELRKMVLGELLPHCPIYGKSTSPLFHYPCLNCPINNHPDRDLSALMCNPSSRILPK